LKDFLGRFGEPVEGLSWRSFGLIFFSKFGAVSRDIFLNILGCVGVVFGGDCRLIHTWAIVEEIFNPLSVSLGASLESRCCHLILDSSV
jgi:hypothetical protein